MKKFLIVIAIVLGIVVLAAFLIPVIFKDDIRAAIDKALSESVNADFVFETEDFSVSLFEHFPNPSAKMKSFGIINRAPFEGEVLFAVEELNAVISLSSLFGDQIVIKGIEMENPIAHLKVLEDGTANWDIALELDSAATSAPDTAAVSYNIGIDNWQIKNGEVSYIDLSIPFALNVRGLNHTGSGDFTQDVIDMETYSKADSVTVTFDGTEYVSDKTAEIDMALRMSDNFENYEFRENKIRINEFEFGFDGGFKMLQDGFDLNLTFNSQNNSFKSLLSLVPGMYHDEFEQMEATGELQFEGLVKGIYDSLQYPAFDITLNVNDASFKYPEVEESFSEIQMDLNLKNETNTIENTRIALNNFHLKMGNQPFDGKLIVENLINYPLEAALKGNVNLESISRVMPMEGTSLKGVLNIDIEANGMYDSIKQIMPKIDGKIVLNDGYIKSADFPATLDKFNVQAAISNPTGNFKDFLMDLSQFSFTMDGESFTGRLSVANLNNYTWDLLAKGNVDLDKLDKIMELNDMELSGRLAANINTKGNMQSLDAERYDQLPTSGTLQLNNFGYSDTSLPYNVSISEAKASFNPQRMELSSMSGTVGESDFNVNGYVTNYIGYILNDNEVLKGAFTFNSQNLNLNEFMTEEEEAAAVNEDTPAGVIEIPKNIDFTLNSNIKQAQMMDMEFKDVTGKIIARDGVASMENLNFNLLDGQFIVNGSYNTADVSQPEYNFDLNIQNLSIAQAFSKFEVVKNYVPIAEKMTGKFSTDFSLNGLLDQEMSPVLSSIDGKGLVKILQASLKDSKFVKGLTSVTKLENTDQINFKDLKLNASIENGTLLVQPFDFNILGYDAVIEGATGIDGRVQFLANITLPAGKAAQAFNQFTGADPNQNIVLPVMISGTYADPQFGLQTAEIKDELQQAAKEKAKEELKEGVQDIVQDNLKDGKLKETLGGLLGTKNDSTQKADTTKKEQNIEQKVEEEAKETIKNLLKKKKGN